VPKHAGRESGRSFIVIIHSEVFPGTYASTTETADYLINALHLQRHAVLESGPAGMQMPSETHPNGLTILAFAGNTAPDHIDHFHGLPVFLKMILDQEIRRTDTSLCRRNPKLLDRRYPLTLNSGSDPAILLTSAFCSSLSSRAFAWPSPSLRLSSDPFSKEQARTDCAKSHQNLD
jgi:hypothetical protein